MSFKDYKCSEKAKEKEVVEISEDRSNLSN